MNQSFGFSDQSLGNRLGLNFVESNLFPKNYSNMTHFSNSGVISKVQFGTTSPQTRLNLQGASYENPEPKLLPNLKGSSTSGSR